MKIHVLASIGNVQASPQSPKPSNPAEIIEYRQILTWNSVHLASVPCLKGIPQGRHRLPNFLASADLFQSESVLAYL